MPALTIDIDLTAFDDARVNCTAIGVDLVTTCGSRHHTPEKGQSCEDRAGHHGPCGHAGGSPPPQESPICR